MIISITLPASHHHLHAVSTCAENYSSVVLTHWWIWHIAGN